MNRRDFFLAAGAVALPATSWAEAAKGGMRITGLETDLLRFPPGKPFADAIHNFGGESGGVVLRLHTVPSPVARAWCRPFWSRKSSRF
jgi:hypothetical protein